MVASVAKDGRLSISSVDGVPSGRRHSIPQEGSEAAVDFRSTSRELVFRVRKTRSGITGRFIPEET